MFADVIWFPEQASTTARHVDWLFYFLTSVTGAVALLVAFLLIFFSVRYRRRPGQSPPPAMHGSTPLELTWTLTTLAIFMVFFVWGATIYYGAYRAPDHATIIYGIGRQWMWKFQHPDGQREISDLHVPVGQPFKLLLTSEDVIHSFFVPEFRVHMDVLPMRYTSVWFEATKPGKYHLFCSQYCGTNHAGMVGTVYVMEQTAYQDWLQLQAPGSAATRGEQVFLKYRCNSCHAYSDREKARAPNLEELFGKEVRYRLPGETSRLQDYHTTIADDDYIRDSVYDPAAKIVAGWENIMPSFRGQVSAQEIIDLTAYIKSLKRGQTPKRVDDFRPPVDTPPINPQK